MNNLEILELEVLKRLNFNKKNSCYNENIKVLSNYLIQLYFRTGKKYHCRASKINSLLAIYFICCIKEGLDFDVEFKIEQRIPFVNDFVMKYLPTIIVEGTVEEDGKTIEDELGPIINLGYFYSYQQQYGINEEDFIGIHSKELIISIFRKFGNYNNLELKSMLTQIKEELEYIEVKGKNNKKICVDRYNAYKYFNSSEIEKYKNSNEIMKFISEFKNKCEYCNCYPKQIFYFNTAIKEFNGLLTNDISSEFYVYGLSKMKSVEEQKEILNYEINIFERKITKPKISDELLNLLNKFNERYFLKMSYKNQKKFLLYITDMMVKEQSNSENLEFNIKQEQTTPENILIKRKKFRRKKYQKLENN